MAESIERCIVQTYADYKATIAHGYEAELDTAIADVATSIRRTIASYLVPDRGWFTKVAIGFDANTVIHYARRIGPAHADILYVREAANIYKTTFGDLMKRCKSPPESNEAIYLMGAILDYGRLPATVLMRQVAEDAHKIGPSPGCVCPYNECPAGEPYYPEYYIQKAIEEEKRQIDEKERQMEEDKRQMEETKRRMHEKKIATERAQQKYHPGQFVYYADQQKYQPGKFVYCADPRCAEIYPCPTHS